MAKYSFAIQLQNDTVITAVDLKMYSATKHEQSLTGLLHFHFCLSSFFFYLSLGKMAPQMQPDISLTRLSNSPIIVCYVHARIWFKGLKYFKNKSLRTSVEVYRVHSQTQSTSQEIHDTVTVSFNQRARQR